MVLRSDPEVSRSFSAVQHASTGSTESTLQTVAGRIAARTQHALELARENADRMAQGSTLSSELNSDSSRYCSPGNVFEAPARRPRISIATIVLACGTSIAIVSHIVLAVLPRLEFAEGSFGNRTLFSRPHALALATFDEFADSTVPGVWAATGDAATGDAATGDTATSDADDSSESQDYVWRRLVFAYQADPLDVDYEGEDSAEIRHRILMREKRRVEVLLDSKVRDFESVLRSFRRWGSLCFRHVPFTHRALCRDGDSFAAARFAEPVDPSIGADTQGLLKNYSMDGRARFASDSRAETIALYSVLDPLRIQRWLPLQENEDDPPSMRSTFAFYLPSTVANIQWREFLNEDLKPFLRELDFDGVQVYSTIDDAGDFKEKEFQDGMPNLHGVLITVVVLAMFTTFLASQRLVMAFGVFLVFSLTTAFDGFVRSRIPAVAIVSWGITGVMCVEMACGTARALDSFPKEMLTIFSSPREIFRRRAMVRIFKCLSEAFAPSLVLGLALVTCTQTDVLIVDEFTLQAGSDVLIAFLFGLVCFPASWSVSCRLRSLFIGATVSSQNKFIGFFTPWEYGQGHDVRGLLGRRAVELCMMCNGNLGFKMCMIIMWVASAVIFITVSCGHDLLAHPARLFDDEFRLGAWMRLSDRFAPLQPLPMVLEESVNLLTCHPDAYSSLGCSIFECHGSEQDSEQEGRCSCFSQSQTGECAGMSARLFGISNPSYQAEDWEAYATWAASSASTSIDPSTIQVKKAAAIWRHTSWESGEGLLIPHVLSLTSEIGGGNNLNDPLDAVFGRMDQTSRVGSSLGKEFEDACLRLMCFCGPERCNDPFAGSVFGGRDKWSKIPLPSPVPPAPGNTSEITSQVPTESEIENENLVRVVVVFGLAKPWAQEFGLASQAPGARIPIQNASFRMEDLDAQRSFLALCEGTDPRLQVRLRRCWPERMKKWLYNRNELYPVHPDSFYERLNEFFADPTTTEPGFSADSKYFWLDGAGKIIGFYIEFFADDPVDAEQRPLDGQVYYRLWQRYVGERREISSERVGAPWVLIPAWGEQESGVITFNLIGSLMVHFCLWTTLSTWLLTQSIGLALVALLGYWWCCMLAGLVQLEDCGRMGMLHVAQSVAFVAGLVAPLMRAGQQYYLVDPIASSGIREPIESDHPASMRRGMATTFDVDELVPGSVSMERRMRAAQSMVRSFESAAGAAIASLLLLPAAFGPWYLYGPRLLGLAFIAGSLVAVPLVVIVCPAFFALGLAPSRIFEQAVVAIVRFKLHSKDPEDECAFEEKVQRIMEHAQVKKAAATLGLSLTVVSPDMCEVPTEPRNVPRRSSLVACETAESPDIKVLALDIYAATAMPPFHSVNKVRAQVKHSG